MDISSLGAQKFYNFDTVKELKVSRQEAIDKIKHNGLDEVIFSAGGKDYIAVSGNMKTDLIKENPFETFNGEKVKIHYIENEINTAGEAAKAAMKSIPGIGVSTVAGGAAGVLGMLVYGLSNVMDGGGNTVGSLLSFAAGAAVGAGAGMGASAGVGAVYGALKKEDYSSILAITK